MSKVLRQSAKPGRGKTLADGWIPTGLRFASSQETKVQFSNGKELAASCLRCIDTPCARFTDAEVVPENFERFPADRNPDVCAAGAINYLSGAPTIDGNLCLLCGVCATRCPVGAIKLVPGKGAVVNDSVNAAFVEVNERRIDNNKIDREIFEGIPSEGTHLIESDAVISDVFDRLQQAWVRVGDRFPNLLARNLLIGAGVGASLGRKGNNHMRMDLILSLPEGRKGMAEVEFGQEAVLDAPRDTMDALAVLASRYEWGLSDTTAIIVSDVLPNRRSEYWHIIQDISKVFGLRIGTVTIFSLMLFNWNRWMLVMGKSQPFYVDRDTSSYRAEVLEVVIGRPLNLSKLPRPEIDIAK